MVNEKILYLSKAEVASVDLKMADIIQLLEKVFVEKGHGRVQMPPKPGIHPGEGDNFLHAMPAYIPALNSAGLKWVSGYPGNTAKGLPQISGLLVFNDPETGMALAVMDCEWITSMRTAAATAVSAKRLARPESSKLGVLGLGVEGFTNTLSLSVVFPIKEVYAYDVLPEAAQRYSKKVQEELGLKVILVDKPQKAVTGMDLVVTAGPVLKHPHKTIKPGWLDKGAFASLVDFDAYWEPAAMQEVDKFCTDDLAQFEYYKTVGHFREAPPVHADLGELVTGKKPGRQSPEERTIAANLGLALDDMAVAPTIYQRALEKKVGTWLER